MQYYREQFNQLQHQHAALVSGGIGKFMNYSLPSQSSIAASSSDGDVTLDSSLLATSALSPEHYVRQVRLSKNCIV